MKLETTINLINEKVFIRTLTYHYTGRVVGENDLYLILDSAAWIASSGRFNAALTTGKLDEVEPIPGKVLIAKQNIVDVLEWRHELPNEVI